MQLDFAILGGGIAGLWALDLLRDRGYSAALFETAALGQGQTIASQGIIHGGIKYALAGQSGADAQALAGMPEAWRACLGGHGQVDLGACPILSDATYLWSPGDLPSRLTGLLASKLLRTPARKLARGDFPLLFQVPEFTGTVYRLDEPVLDVSALLRQLGQCHRDSIFSLDPDSSRLQVDNRSATLALPHCKVEPKRLLLCAGAGNEALLRQLGGTTPAMQRRPLQQVLVRHKNTLPLFGHCLGAGTSPRLTVSTHISEDSHSVWYLGGDLATQGAELEPARLIEQAQRELTELLPWVDLSDADWGTRKAVRAEPDQRSGHKPEGAFLGPAAGLDNVLVAWPTKLALCPALGAALLEQLDAADLRPSVRQDVSALQTLPRPIVALPPWDTCFA